MKEIPYTTAPLVGTDGQKSSLRQLLFGNLAGNQYYEAHSEESGVYILWMEFSRFGQLRAYPCVLHERDHEPLVFMPFSDPESDDRNRALLERWEALVTPERFQSAGISALGKDAFQKIYRAYRNGQA
ncbi:MAG: hypothetical protein ACI3XD_02320 [Oscillospiraceae bacterium]